MASRKFNALLASFVALTFLFTTLVATPQAHAAEIDDEQMFVQMINGLRASKGLGSLQIDSQLTQGGKSWANEMNSSDTLKHSPDISAGLSHNWSLLGENVGVHSLQGSEGVQQLFDAFVASPAHYENLVNPHFQYVGVGVSYSQATGKMWTAHRFMAVDSAPNTTAPPPATNPPPTAPPPTNPPATPPPATSPPITSPPATAAPTSPATTPATTQPTTTQPTTTQPTTTTTPPTSPPTTSSTSENGLPAFEGVNRFTKSELVQFLVAGLVAAAP